MGLEHNWVQGVKRRAKDESLSHTVGLEQTLSEEVSNDARRESPSHTVGLEKDKVKGRVYIPSAVSIPHSGLGTVIELMAMAIHRRRSPSHPVGLELLSFN